MIAEEQIKKAAEEILGKKDKNWYLDTYYDRPHIKKIRVQCNCCYSTLCKVFDIRESLNYFDIKKRLRELKLPRPKI